MVDWHSTDFPDNFPLKWQRGDFRLRDPRPLTKFSCVLCRRALRPSRSDLCRSVWCLRCVVTGKRACMREKLALGWRCQPDKNHRWLRNDFTISREQCKTRNEWLECKEYIILLPYFHSSIHSAGQSVIRSFFIHSFIHWFIFSIGILRASEVDVLCGMRVLIGVNTSILLPEIIVSWQQADR